MERKYGLGRAGLIALAALTLGCALAAPQAAWAGDWAGDKDKKGKDGKTPIIIKDPIITPDPPKKK